MEKRSWIFGCDYEKEDVLKKLKEKINFLL